MAPRLAALAALIAVSLLRAGAAEEPAEDPTLAQVRALGEEMLPSAEELETCGGWVPAWDLPDAAELYLATHLRETICALSSTTSEEHWQRNHQVLKQLVLPPEETEAALGRYILYSAFPQRRSPYATAEERERAFQEAPPELLRQALESHYRATRLRHPSSLAGRLRQYLGLLEADIRRARPDPAGPPPPPPLAELSNQEIQDLLLRELTLVQEATVLLLYHCPEPDQLLASAELDPSLPFTALVVEVRRLAPGRLSEAPDLTAGEVAELSGQVQDVLGLLRDLILSLLPGRLQTARSPEVKEALQAQADRARTTTMTLTRRELGDCSYVLSSSQPGPTPPNLPTLSGYLRNGRTLVILSMEGNEPLDQMTGMMDRWLALMDRRTRPSGER